MSEAATVRNRVERPDPPAPKTARPPSASRSTVAGSRRCRAGSSSESQDRDPTSIGSGERDGSDRLERDDVGQGRKPRPAWFDPARTLECEAHRPQHHVELRTVRGGRAGDLGLRPWPKPKVVTRDATGLARLAGSAGPGRLERHELGRPDPGEAPDLGGAPGSRPLRPIRSRSASRPCRRPVGRCGGWCWRGCSR